MRIVPLRNVPVVSTTAGLAMCFKPGGVLGGHHEASWTASLAVNARGRQASGSGQLGSKPSRERGGRFRDALGGKYRGSPVVGLASSLGQTER